MPATNPSGPTTPASPSASRSCSRLAASRSPAPAASFPIRSRRGLPDLPTNAFFQYGVYEGVPRILDLMDKHQVKLSSFMIGQAVEKAPDLAREIVKRGHEAAAHGRTWQNSYFLDPEAERKFIADSVETIQKVTGQQPIGWNAYWMRNSPHTLDILQSLGFKYHIDEPSMDEPFIVKLKGGDFVTVPYTFHMNDIVSFPFENYNPAAYEQALKDEFDQLYEEGAHKRRMMVDLAARPHLRTRQPRARARPLPRLCEVEARRLVRPQGRDRQVGRSSIARSRRSMTAAPRRSAVFQVRRPEQPAKSSSTMFRIDRETDAGIGSEADAAHRRRNDPTTWRFAGFSGACLRDASPIAESGHAELDDFESCDSCRRRVRSKVMQSRYDFS